MSFFSRTDRSFLAQWWWTVDRPLLGTFLVLALIGVMMVTTASPSIAEHHDLNSFHFLIRHIIILVPALCMMIVVSMLNQKILWRLATVVYGLSILAMIFVLFFGMEIKGAQRWVHVFGFSLQPSEFCKPAFAIISARFMAMQKEKEGFPGYIITAGFYVLTVGLLILQPDLGMTCVVTAIWVVQIFLAGFPFRILFALGILGVGGMVTAYFTLDHVESRINRFLNPESGDNYQVEKSIEAIQSGGLIGVGPGQGTVKLDLPDAHADFIFSVGAEEMGLIFILCLVALYGFVLVRGFNKLMDSNNMFYVLAVGGLLTMFGLQAMIHMGSALNILPTKGMTLPFISYGGSSLLSMSFAMGVCLSLLKKQGRMSIAKAGLAPRARPRDKQDLK
jgi:cell division protein FtsW